MKVEFLKDCTIDDNPKVGIERVPAGTVREITDKLAAFLAERDVVRLIALDEGGFVVDDATTVHFLEASIIEAASPDEVPQESADGDGSKRRGRK